MPVQGGPEVVLEERLRDGDEGAAGEELREEEKGGCSGGVRGVGGGLGCDDALVAVT